eukprot:365463-Chlamydomonas_euryale.AAC.5
MACMGCVHALCARGCARLQVMRPVLCRWAACQLRTRMTPRRETYPGWYGHAETHAPIVNDRHGHAFGS